MTQPTPTPCGAWPSPLSPEAAAVGAVSLSYAEAAEGRLYWVEGRPAEGGRSVLMVQQADGEVGEALGPGSNVRSRVHEYGGSPYVAVGGRIVHADFVSQQLQLADGEGRTHALTPPGCRYADFDAAPDGRHFVAVREDHRAGGEAVNSVVLLDADAAQDAGCVLHDGHDFVAWPRLSPDGRRLAFVAWNHPAMPWDETELCVGELEGGVLAQLRRVAGGPGVSVLEPQWADDGSLYFLCDRSGWWNLYCWRQGLGQGEGQAQGQVQALTALEAEIGAPPWNLGLRSYTLTGDGRVLLRVGRGGVESLQLLDLSTLSLTPLNLPYVAFGSPGMRDARTAFAFGAAVDEPPVLFTLDLVDGHLQVVRRAGNAPLPAAAVSHPEAIEFPTAAGPGGAARTAHAWFYPPTNPACLPLPGELPPLMVMLHGGPTAHSPSAFKVTVQFWTTRGFAVVDVNYGGSTGYGRAYRERLRGQWGVVDLRDAVAAVDHLVAAGRVDGRRVAIRGGSAGGYTVLSALAFSDRFAAGINYFGVADLETLVADTHKFESRYLDTLVAPLPAGRAVYRARSPVHHMDRCRAALITFQGSDDHAVPPQQSRDIVAAARAAGCPVAYIEFEGEGHGFRQGPHIVRALQAELVFLGRVFGYQPAGDLPALQVDNAAALPGPAGAGS